MSRLRFFLCHEKYMHVHCVLSQNEAFVHCSVMKKNMENGKLRGLFLAHHRISIASLSTQNI